MSENMSEDEIEAIAAKLRAWPMEDPAGAVAFLREHWAYADWGWSESDAVEEVFGLERRYEISTAGWSDNEALIAALEENRFLWAFCWYSTRRGGHYELRIKAQPQPPKEPHEHREDR